MRVNILVIIALAGAALIASCVRDATTAPQPLIGQTKLRASQLEASATNAYRCSVLAADAKATATGGYSLSDELIKGADSSWSSAAPLGLYAFYSIGSTSKKLAVQANCVLPMTSQAARYAFQYFIANNAKRFGRSGGALRDFFSGTIDCFYDPEYDDVTCGPENYVGQVQKSV